MTDWADTYYAYLYKALHLKCYFILTARMRIYVHSKYFYLAACHFTRINTTTHDILHRSDIILELFTLFRLLFCLFHRQRIFYSIFFLWLIKNHGAAFFFSISMSVCVCRFWSDKFPVCTHHKNSSNNSYFSIIKTLIPKLKRKKSIMCQ